MREKIAGWIIGNCHKTCGRVMNVEKGTALIEADEILALPSGLVAKSVCPKCKGIPGPKVSCGPDECDKGTITRPLSIQEAIEWAIQVAKNKHYVVTREGEGIEVSK